MVPHSYEFILIERAFYAQVLEDMRKEYSLYINGLGTLDGIAKYITYDETCQIINDTKILYTVPPGKMVVVFVDGGLRGREMAKFYAEKWKGEFFYISN